MKRQSFAQEQIIAVSREHEAGVSAADMRRKHGLARQARHGVRNRYLVTENRENPFPAPRDAGLIRSGFVIPLTDRMRN